MAELWTQREDTGPNPNVGEGGFVYDSDRSVSVLLAKSKLNNPSGETWEWDGNSWVQVDDMGPTWSSAMTFFAGRHSVLAFTLTGLTWERSNAEWTQVADTGPKTVWVMVYDQSRARAVAVEAGTGHTWEWDGSSWTIVADSGVGSRSHFALAYDAKNKVTVLFGGNSTTNVLLGDTWTWDGKRWKQASSKRVFTAMTYDDANARSVLFGGWDGSQELGDTWQWDGKVWRQLSDMGPSARHSPSLCYDSHRQRTVLFGGASAADTWEFFNQT